MVIGVVVIIIILAVALSAIGAWIVIQGRPEQEAPTYAPIDRSGSYAVLRHPVREDLERAKPKEEHLRTWLSASHPQLSSDESDQIIFQWLADLEQSIAIVEEGDKEKVATFRVILSDKDLHLCGGFLTQDNYLTREQILNHPELLPPYYLGCGCKLALKQPWDNPSKSGWKAVLPQHDGRYPIPDWRHLA